VLLNGLGYFPIPLAFVSEYTISEYFVKPRSVRKSLALGYLRNILVSFKMIAQAVDKSSSPRIDWPFTSFQIVSFKWTLPARILP